MHAFTSKGYPGYQVLSLFILSKFFYKVINWYPAGELGAGARSAMYKCGNSVLKYLALKDIIRETVYWKYMKVEDSDTSTVICKQDFVDNIQPPGGNLIVQKGGYLQDIKVLKKILHHSHERHELLALERLMKEFFDGNTGNEKRKEIERLLTNFKNQQGCWKLCFDYLAHTKCQYVSMFCLTTIEDIINKQWVCLPWEEKSEVKSHMCAYVLQNHETLSPCLKSKSVKLVVDIARLDWPHFYPDFFTSIIQLLQKPNTRQLGLLYLLTTSEELIAPREDLRFDRKNELKKLLLAQMPQVFSILFEFLTDEGILMNPDNGCLLLRVLTHLFTWVPASQVPDAFISIIFQLAAKIENKDLAVLAIGTLNEMLYRHWVLPHCNQITYHALELSQTLLNSPLDHLSQVYVEKFSEFLRLVLALQLSQTEVKLESVEALLSAALTFTVRQPTLVPGFSTCLDIWLHLLDNSNSKKYSGAFLSLVPQTLNKIQFRQNGKQIKDFDDDVLDDDGETEWKKFITPCIEIVAKVAEMEPLAILQLVFERWVELCQLYGHVCTNLSAALQDVGNIQSLLRDLSTFTQIMGRLQSQCCGDNWKEESQFMLARLTLQHLLTLNELGVNIQYHSMSDNMKVVFQKVHAEALASLKSWCYWLPLLQTENSTKQMLDEFVTRIINGCVPFLIPTSPTVLQHCSAHVIATITSTVRPRCLWELETVKCLFSNRLTHLQVEDQYLIQGALVNCLILKWPTTEDQLWDQRSKLLTTYIDELTVPLISVPLQYSLQYKPVIISTLQMIQYIIKLYKSEGQKSKKLLCIAFQKSVEYSLALFPLYVTDAQVNQEILQFFLVLLECLQQQVGVTFTQVAVQTFIDVYTRQQLQVSLAQENGGGLQQLLQILDLVVQTPGLSASKVTPMAVTLCLQLFEPVLTDNASPSVQESLFQLVYSVLVHKWQYFFKSTVDADVRCKEFLHMMKAIGQSFFLPNIDLFRQNLRNIERLNTKWNLYYKELFKKELHPQFLTVLFNILLAKRHSLVNEEVAIVICNLILVDTDNFFNDFLPNFLGSVESIDSFQKMILLDNFTKDKDMPSMIQNIYRLTNDLICYQLCNSSVPMGTIRL